MNYQLNSPIIALASAQGQSAIAVIRLSGANCINLLAPFFSKTKQLLQTATGQMVYGHLYNNLQHTEQLDEVMLAPFWPPHSYTGEESGEIYLHGNMHIADNLIKLLCRNGFRLALPGEFTYRAYLNGKLSLTEAEAVHELITAPSTAATNAALLRLSGALTKKVSQIYHLIIERLAAVNVLIDYGDELEETDNLPISYHHIIAQLQQLLASYNRSKQLQNGALVVIAGQPNVGKSSLFNVLVGSERAIVSPVAGTTRDYIEAAITLNGQLIRLIDTAGIRPTTDEIELLGINKAVSLLEEADVIIYLTNDNKQLSEELINFSSKTLIVGSKSDLKPTQAKGLAVSAVTGSGLEKLITELNHRLSSQNNLNNEVMLGSLRQYQLVEEALTAMFNLNYINDLSEQSFYLKKAGEALAALLGQNARQDAITTMFSSFCLGK
ncbi:MAG: tRNA uridine-5-carboxymethylaminomethyl(34) synthesis GTPase MnmE [Spirochaetaceae bacterium]|nr:tRNA uridine-5-carboxymethylaminomethyl(34) synthesis GTPase MnmE [Spirochaetaceae bacterium]